MRISHLRYFYEISLTKNITMAAKNLHISQPSLSFAVKTLEDELGIPLLFRNSHTVALTDAGEKFAVHAERIIQSVDNLSDMMHRHAHLIEGKLRIGMLWIGGYMNLFSLMNDFRSSSPAITYEFTFDGSDILLQKLLNRSLHGVFVISSEAALESQKEFDYLKISEEEYKIIVPKNNDLSERPCVSIKDLDGENIIMPSSKTLLHRQLSILFHEHGITPKILCSTSQPDIIGQFTGEGLASGFASETVAEKICAASCRVMIFDEHIRRKIYYVTLKELNDYPLTKAFKKFLESKFNCVI